MNVKKSLWQAFISPNYPKWLLGIFSVWFGVWAIGPSHPSTANAHQSWYN